MPIIPIPSRETDRDDPVAQAEAQYKSTMRAYHPLYRTTCIPGHEWQRSYLESLRYKWRYHATDIRVIQVLHYIGMESIWLMIILFLLWYL